MTETRNIDPLPRPAVFNKAFAARALEHPEIYLSSAFVWAATPQGRAFWRSQRDAAELSPEGRAAIEQWIKDAEERADT
jgi:hypothetical protein